MKIFNQATMLRAAVDILIGLIAALVIGGPAYVAYSVGYTNGGHDARRWTSTVQQHWTAAEATERSQHEEILYHQCDLRVEHAQRMLEIRYHLDAGETP